MSDHIVKHQKGASGVDSAPIRADCVTLLFFHLDGRHRSALWFHTTISRDHHALTGPRKDAGGPPSGVSLTFDTLGLRPEYLRAISDQGYTEPTPVQAQAIPAVLNGTDLLAGAQTGTGKTAAFVLPMLQLLNTSRPPGPRRIRGLVIVPTRELALQVEQSVRTYGAHRPMRSAAIFGGMRMDGQVKRLKHGVDIVVATPGRLLDHVRQRTIDLRQVEILVLDEGDRMLDMGFIHDIRKILEILPAERQTLLFSATFTPHIRHLATEFLRDPVSIDVAPRNATAAPISQLVHPVDRGRKRELLTHLVRRNGGGQVLVFTRTKRGANRLAEQLVEDGINAAAIHGNKSQSQRVRALTSFKQGRSQVLVATDVAARGLDIDALPYVVNFEIPNVPEDYVHRIGRTGRAGLEGTAISLVAAEEQKHIRAIEKLQTKAIERQVVDGFEPSRGGNPQPAPQRGGRPRPAPSNGQQRNRPNRSVSIQTRPAEPKPWGQQQTDRPKRKRWASTEQRQGRSDAGRQSGPGKPSSRRARPSDAAPDTRTSSGRNDGPRRSHGGSASSNSMPGERVSGRSSSRSEGSPSRA
jgi:ATP-dependent RNA helicase RhlE